MTDGPFRYCEEVDIGSTPEGTTYPNWYPRSLAELQAEDAEDMAEHCEGGNRAMNDDDDTPGTGMSRG